MQVRAVREITPEALARPVGWSLTLEALAGADPLLAVRREIGCRRRGGQTEATGVPKNPH